MQTPHFLKLAEIDAAHFIAACRQGIVHLTWGRNTIRLTRDEFQRLARLVEQSADVSPPASLRDGDLSLHCRLDEDCEFRIGRLVLLLSPREFRAFVRIVAEAARRLEELLASGVWEEPEEAEPPPDPFAQLRRFLFSSN